MNLFSRILQMANSPEDLQRLLQIEQERKRFMGPVGTRGNIEALKGGNIGTEGVRLPPMRKRSNRTV
jgi:hypothetical protein